MTQASDQNDGARPADDAQPKAVVIYLFQHFQICSEPPQLIASGTQRDIPPRHLDLLLLLLQQPEKPRWTHEELLAALWPGRVVTTQSVARLVADARKSFAAVGIKGRVVETLHGHGYRLAPVFVAGLTCLPHKDVSKSSGNNAVADDLSSAQPVRRGARVAIYIAAAIAFGILIALAKYWWPAATPPVLFSEAQAVAGRILWVDDNPHNNTAEVADLRNRGYGVHQVKSSADALTLVKIYHFDLIISDMGRHGNPLAGLELLSALRAANFDLPVVYYTLVVNPPLLAEVAARGGQGAAESSDALSQLVETHAGSRHKTHLKTAQ